MMICLSDLGVPQTTEAVDGVMATSARSRPPFLRTASPRRCVPYFAYLISQDRLQYKQHGIECQHGAAISGGAKALLWSRQAQAAPGLRRRPPEAALLILGCFEKGPYIDRFSRSHLQYGARSGIVVTEARTIFLHHSFSPPPNRLTRVKERTSTARVRYYF